jgi:hypothetical protein
VIKPNAYQLGKLAEMSRANARDVEALKVEVAAAKAEDVLPLRTRAHKLEKRIKTQRALERALGLHKKPAEGVPP